MIYLLKTRYLRGPGPVYERAAIRGRMLPAGLRFIDSWIVDDDNLDICYEVVETDDPAVLEVWLSRWSDLIAAEAFPVIKSPQAAARAGFPWDGSPMAPTEGTGKTTGETRSHESNAGPQVALPGGCFCGLVRFVVRARPAHATACHCVACRRTSGAPLVAWCTVPIPAFEWTTGSATAFRSSDHGTRRFCSRCGTQLTFESSGRPGEIDVATASLDDPERVPPRDHTWTSSQLSWMRDIDTLPRFATQRG